MRALSEFNRRLRTARHDAGYNGGADAWHVLRGLYDATPSLSTFNRWETDPDAEYRADPGAVAVLCYRVYKIAPETLGSPVIVDRIKQLEATLPRGKEGTNDATRRQYSKAA